MERRAQARGVGESLLALNPAEYFQKIPDSYTEIVEAFESIDLGKEIWQIVGKFMPGPHGARFRRRYGPAGDSDEDF